MGAPDDLRLRGPARRLLALRLRGRSAAALPPRVPPHAPESRTPPMIGADSLDHRAVRHLFKEMPARAARSVVVPGHGAGGRREGERGLLCARRRAAAHSSAAVPDEYLLCFDRDRLSSHRGVGALVARRLPGAAFAEACARWRAEPPQLRPRPRRQSPAAAKGATAPSRFARAWASGAGGCSRRTSCRSACSAPPIRLHDEPGLRARTARLGRTRTEACAECGPARTAARLIDELESANAQFNLTAIRDRPGMLRKHVLDSLSLQPFLRGLRIADVGTGAGFPGFAARDRESGSGSFLLIEATGKKARFVAQTAERLGLTNVEVVNARAENYRPFEPFDTVVARALSSLADFVAYAGHLCSPEGRLLAMKGKRPGRGDFGAAEVLPGARRPPGQNAGTGRRAASCGTLHPRRPQRGAAQDRACT